MEHVAYVTGDRVRVARTAAGLTQQTLATKAGIATKTLSRIEGGEDVRLGTLTAIAVALDMTVADLLADPDPVSS